LNALIDREAEARAAGARQLARVTPKFVYNDSVRRIDRRGNMAWRSWSRAPSMA